MNGFRIRSSIRNAVLASFATGAAFVPAAYSADSHIHIRQANKASDGNDVGRTEIVVDGPSTLGYDSRAGDTIDIWVATHIDKSQSTPDYQNFVVQVESTEMAAEITAASRRYKVTIPYADPRSGSVSGQRNSAIQSCNNRLGSLTGAARAAFLRDGAEINAVNAYRLKAVATYTTIKKGKKKGAFEEAPQITEHTDEATAMANAVIVCRPLDRPRARNTAPTTQGATPKPGTALPLVIAAAELRIEPQKEIAVGKQMCPAELRLYGRIEARRAFNGKAVIFGTGYLSPVTTLTYDGPGNRNIVATYKLSWATSGGLANSPTAPKSQTVALTMNVTNAENKVQESVKESITVNCRPMRAAAAKQTGAIAADVDNEPERMEMWAWHEAARASEPAAARARRVGGPLTIAKRSDVGTPAVDAAIRKVDRNGPGGATRLWVRNGGTQSSGQCELAAKKEGHKEWIIIESVQMAPGETREIKAAMPRDSDVEFAITCPGEPDDLLADNIARMP